jgi:hypothetical protein
MLLKKSLCHPLAISVALATATIALPFKAEALTFNFEFDNTPDGTGTVTPPFVGTGTFSFDGDPGDGDFALTSLPNFNFSFNIGANTFTNANIATPVANVLVRIATVGSDRFVNFGGSGGGPNNGSIDFSGPGILTFQPNFGSLYFSAPFFGTYQGIAVTDTPAVPEPATVLGLLSIAGVGLLSKRQKQGK